MCLVAVAPCLLHARASLTWWRQKIPRESHPPCWAPASFPSSGPGPRVLNPTAWKINCPKSLSQWLNRWPGFTEAEPSLMWWQGIVGWPGHPLPNQHPNCSPCILNCFWDKFCPCSCLPLLSLLSSFLIPLFSLELPIVSASPQDFQSTNPEQPSPGNSKGSRALPPKAAQEEEIATGRGSIYPTQLGELLDVWPSCPSPLLLLSALFCTWTWNEKPWFQPLAGVILSPRPAQLGNLVSLQPRPSKTCHSKWLKVKSASSRRGGGQHVLEQGEGWESSPSSFI